MKRASESIKRVSHMSLFPLMSRGTLGRSVFTLMCEVKQEQKLSENGDCEAIEVGTVACKGQGGLAYTVKARW